MSIVGTCLKVSASPVFYGRRGMAEEAWQLEDSRGPQRTREKYLWLKVKPIFMGKSWAENLVFRSALSLFAMVMCDDVKAHEMFFKLRVI